MMMNINMMMMNLWELFVIVFVSIHLADATAKITNVIGSNPVNAEVGSDIKLQWQISGMQENCAKTFNIFLDSAAKHSNKILTAGTNDKQQETISFEQRQSSSVPFAKQMSGQCDINIPYGTCSFTLKQAGYTANGNIILQYLCISDRADIAIGNVTINTEGGPDACGEHKLTQNITCAAGRSIHERVTLCGKPEPKLYWMIGNQIMNGTIDRTHSNIHQYTYDIIFPGSGNCGKKLKYVAIGYTGLNRTEESQILPQAQNFKGDDTGLDTYATIGIIVASIFLFSLLCVVVCCRCLRNKKKNNNNSSNKDESLWSEDSNMAASAPLASEHV